MNCSCKNCSAFQKELNKKESSLFDINISSYKQWSNGAFVTTTQKMFEDALAKMAVEIAKDLYK